MADYTPQGTQDYSVESGYESADANIGAVVSGLLIIFTSTLVVMAAMFGMFNYLNRQDEVAASKVPIALGTRVIPPEPRLLPSPYSDEHGEAVALKADSPDGFPWDKRNLEIAQQYDEANSYEKYKETDPLTHIQADRIRIPMSRAIELEAGAPTDAAGDEKAPAAVMSWQEQHASLVAGMKNGTMNLVPGSKDTEPTTFDRRAHWETQDEKFSEEASGGTSLKASGMSR